MSFDPAILLRFKRVRVHVCVNDERGVETGYIAAVEVHEPGDDAIVQLVADDLEGIEGGIDDAEITIPDVGTFPITGYHPYVGNICWDAGFMSGAQAKALVDGLIAQHFHVDMWREA